MIQATSVNLVVSAPVVLALSNGAPVPLTLAPGNYVAELNADQQPDWYALYAADSNFQKVLPSTVVANVHLAIDLAGNAILT